MTTIEPIAWDEARRTILEFTQIGYTQKSQDRIWVVATTEDGSGGWAKEHPELIGNPIYLYVDGRTSSYDIWDDAACFLSRRDAEQWRDAVLEEPYRSFWHVLNYGDDHRFERAYLNRELHDLSGADFTPKYKGSQGYFDHRAQVWAEHRGR